MKTIKKILNAIVDLIDYLIFGELSVQEPLPIYPCHVCKTPMDWNTTFRYDYCPRCEVCWGDFLMPINPETGAPLKLEKACV